MFSVVASCSNPKRAFFIREKNTTDASAVGEVAQVSSTVASYGWQRAALEPVSVIERAYSPASTKTDS